MSVDPAANDARSVRAQMRLIEMELASRHPALFEQFGAASPDRQKGIVEVTATPDVFRRWISLRTVAEEMDKHGIGSNSHSP